jgi:hypothetical protein
MLNNTLDVKKLEEGKIVFNNNFESPRKVVDLALNVVKGNAEKKGVTLAVDFGKNLPGLLEFDKSRVTQIVMNLLSNAVKFTPTQGRVEVRLRWFWHCNYHNGDCATCDQRIIGPNRTPIPIPIPISISNPITAPISMPASIHMPMHVTSSNPIAFPPSHFTSDGLPGSIPNIRSGNSVLSFPMHKLESAWFAAHLCRPRLKGYYLEAS